MRFGPAPTGEEDAVLSVLLTGAPGSALAAAQFRAFAQENQYTLEHLWGAYEAGRCVIAALVVPSPGRTGMLFLSPQRRAGRAGQAAELVRRLLNSLDPRKLTLVQALLDPSQSHEAQVVEQAGGRKLAQLIYMQRRSRRSEEALSLPHGMTLLTWREDRRSLFAQAIERSYEKTLDCPGLVGMRDVDDVIAGHMAAGEFDPDLWRVVSDGKRGLGVLLINGVPHRPAAELVYLGLAPKVRGIGLGRGLVTLALDSAARRGARQVILAVDEGNTPALALYRSLGFTHSARKLALIFALSASARSGGGLSTPSSGGASTGG